MKMRKEKIRLDAEPTIEQKIEAILTSGRPSDEIQAELMQLTPKFEYDEIPEFNPDKQTT